MYAEKLILQTDAQGYLQGLPHLPPDTNVEVILLLPKTPKKSHRRPPPELKNKIKIHDDIVSPAVPENDWDALQ